MAYLAGGGVVVVLLLILLAVLGKDESKAEMTEQEFEEEAKQASVMRAAVTGLHKFFQPDRVTQIVEEQQRAKQKIAISGDPPHDSPNSAAPEEKEIHQP